MDSFIRLAWLGVTFIQSFSLSMAWLGLARMQIFQQNNIDKRETFLWGKISGFRSSIKHDYFVGLNVRSVLMRGKELSNITSSDCFL